MKGKFLLFLLLSCMLSSAQVPGYLGKRFSVGYSNYFMASLVGPTANATSRSGEVGLNTTHCLNLEYAIKNRTNFCFSFQKSKTGMDPGSIYIVDNYAGSNYSYYVDYKSTPYKPMQINSYNVSFGFKFFQSGSFAPIGKYNKIEVLVLFNNLTYQKNGFYTYNYLAQRGYYVSLGAGDYNFNTVSIAYTVGRSKVLFDRIVLDAGLRLGFVPGGVLAVVNPDGDITSDSSYGGVTRFGERDFRNETYKRIFGAQFLNVHIGVGFLAF